MQRASGIPSEVRPGVPSGVGARLAANVGAIRALALAGVVVLLAVELLLFFGATADDLPAGDDWVLVASVSDGLGSVFGLNERWFHYRPLQELVVFLTVQTGGPERLHAVNLALAWISAVAVAGLGWRLTRRLGVGALAAAVWVAYGEHFEAFAWSAAGTPYTTSTPLYLAGLLAYVAAHDAATETRRRWAYLGFLACLVLVPFAHEQGITLIGACALYRLFVLEQDASWGRADLAPRVRAWVRDFFVPAMLVLAYIGFKLWLSRNTEDQTPGLSRPPSALVGNAFTGTALAFFPGLDRDDLTYLWRGLWQDRLAGGPIPWFVYRSAVGGALLLLLAAVAWFGRPLYRFLVYWTVLMVGAMIIGLGGIAPRHLFMISVPPAVLWATAVWDLVPATTSLLRRRGVGDAAARRLGPVPAAAVATGLLLCGGAHTVGQMDAWNAAVADSEAIIARIARLSRDSPATTLYLVDMPAQRLPASGDRIYLLPHGNLPETISARFPGRFDEVVAAVLRLPPGTPRTINRRVTPEELDALAQRPETLVLVHTGGKVRRWKPAAG